MPRSHGSEIDVLIQMLSKLPGLGPRSARRAVLHMLDRRDGLMRPLAQLIDHVAGQITPCEVCGNLDTQSPCHVCSDIRRDKRTVCVVEGVADLWALDRSESYRGLYHVLGGTLSALDGIGPDDLTIEKLLQRAESGEVDEIILALGATVDGQTTSHFIAEQLEDTGVKVTGLAHGLPVGGELDYLDDGTLAAAIRARGEMHS